MGREIIRQGDRTDHGGTVIEGSMTDICHGKPISYIGHKVHCPRCGGDYPIVEGVLTTTLYGKGVAVAGMKTSCGAALIPSQLTDTVEWAGGGAAANTAAIAALAPAAAKALASEPAGQEAADDAPAKKITRMYWSYGPDETPVSDVSRHYVDLNLHLETENYQPGETAVVVIKNDDDSELADNAPALELSATVGADGKATLNNVFRGKTVEIGTFT
ncbi:PAAR domain-containing protein [uncultured Massilia sp.]|uniref:PAAR domain-containing protein n=1 Tax=uncultured Massilia sp. TaxID=169973 RepID=UPI00258E7830|nr:PAAR domain-containing protein [uncultured Massilia sp.]